jgi:hypothetical protein
MGRRSKLALAVLLAVAAVVAIALAGTHLATFDDSLTLGDALVAGGTLALAAVTFWLALQTKREVGNSNRSIELAREGIEAQDMPFVIATANPDQHRELDKSTSYLRLWWGFSPDADWLLQIRLWNIGKGPAIARDIRLQGAGRDILGPRSAEIGEIVIGPGQVNDLTLPVIGGEPPLDEDLRGSLQIYYGHIAGTEYMTTSLALIGEQGVRPSNFVRMLSDGEGRPVV